MRPKGVFKTQNDYQKCISFYEDCPKAVLAAIAVSYALRQCNEDFEKLNEEILNEWRCLYESGIVPQKPIKS